MKRDTAGPGRSQPKAHDSLTMVLVSLDGADGDPEAEQLRLSGSSPRTLSRAPGTLSYTPGWQLLLAQDQPHVTARRHPCVTVTLTVATFTRLNSTSDSKGV